MMLELRHSADNDSNAKQHNEQGCGKRIRFWSNLVRNKLQPRVKIALCLILLGIALLVYVYVLAGGSVLANIEAKKEKEASAKIDALQRAVKRAALSNSALQKGLLLLPSPVIKKLEVKPVITLNSAKVDFIKAWRKLPDQQALRYYDTSSVGAPMSRPPLHEEKFLSLEWYNGGFNNVKHSIETVILLSKWLNRTLVLPDPSVDTHRHLHYISDQLQYYQMDRIRSLVPTISFYDFTELIEQGHFPLTYPKDQNWPFSAVSPTSVRMHEKWVQWPLQQIAKIIPWNFWTGLLCIPSCPVRGNRDYEYFKHYTKADQVLSEYSTDDNMDQNKPLILHFPQTLFGFFYRTIYLEPKRRRKWATALVRDFVVLQELHFAYAERIVAFLGGRHSYSCLHLRRGDWVQDKGHVVEMEAVAINTKAVFKGDTKIYVATNERRRELFEPFRKGLGEGVSLMFWDETLETVAAGGNADLVIDPFILPNVEQLVCAQGRAYVGTWLSTFSSAISRFRGYYRDTPDQHIYYADFMNRVGIDFGYDGHMLSNSPSWSPTEQPMPVWNQESPEAWVDLQNEPGEIA